MELLDKLREPKIYDIALFDLGVTVIASILIGDQLGLSRPVSIFSGLALGETIHLALGINTPVTKVITGDNNRNSIIVSGDRYTLPNERELEKIGIRVENQKNSLFQPTLGFGGMSWL